MSARKLGRLAGLVFVLATLFGGVGVASQVAEHETGGSLAASTVQMIDGEVVWG
jgi:hypothetical protein